MGSSHSAKKKEYFQLRFRDRLMEEFYLLKQKIDNNPEQLHQGHIVKLTLLEREINNMLMILDDNLHDKEKRILERIEYLKIKMIPTRKWFGKSEARQLINAIEKEVKAFMPKTRPLTDFHKSTQKKTYLPPLDMDDKIARPKRIKK